MVVRLCGRVYFVLCGTRVHCIVILSLCSPLVQEHFGIVPVEAMYSYRPVIACNSGGPKESVLHEQTGFLCDPTPQSFAEVCCAPVD